MPPMKCLISDCPSKKCPSMKMFSLSRNNALRELWLDYLRPLVPSLENLSKDQLLARKVCSRHFEAKYIQNNKRVRMCGPTLFTPEEIRSGQPTKPFPSTSVNIDHTYSISIPHCSGIDVEDTIRNLIAINHDHNYCLGPVLSDDAIPETPGLVIDETDIAGGNKENDSRDIPTTSMLRVDDMHISVAKEETASRMEGRNATGSSEAAARSPVAATTSDAAGSSSAVEKSPTRINSSTKGAHRVSRDRIVKSVQNLTPKCRKMYFKCREILNSKRRLLYSYQERIEQATQLSDNKTFQEMFKKMTPDAKTLLMMQMNLTDVPPNLRRYTRKQKLMCLRLMKKSPAQYDYFSKRFILPCRRTLRTFCRRVKFTPGLNNSLLRQLKQQVNSWDDKTRLCSIVFDEVSLTPGLTFVESEDRIDGFVHFDIPDKKLCDHALVFMVRGIVGTWRQTFAYYLCEGTTPAAKLKNILREVVDAITAIGLRPKAIICDQGSTFQSCLNSFRHDSRSCQEQRRLSDNQILINDQVLNIVYDPPHLIKGIRNNFLNKDILYNGKLAKWSDIVTVYKADCEVGDIRMLHKLTDEHVIPEKIKKMKVKNCTQALSERTAAMLNYSSKFGHHVDGTPVSSSMATTSEVVLFFDRLFDSVNGSRGASTPGKMRGPVPPRAFHLCMDLVKQWKRFRCFSKPEWKGGTYNRQHSLRDT